MVLAAGRRAGYVKEAAQLLRRLSSGLQAAPENLPGSHSSCQPWSMIGHVNLLRRAALHRLAAVTLATAAALKLQHSALALLTILIGGLVLACAVPMSALVLPAAMTASTLLLPEPGMPQKVSLLATLAHRHWQSASEWCIEWSRHALSALASMSPLPRARLLSAVGLAASLLVAAATDRPPRTAGWPRRQLRKPRSSSLTWTLECGAMASAAVLVAVLFLSAARATQLGPGLTQPGSGERGPVTVPTATEFLSTTTAPLAAAAGLVMLLRRS